MESSGKPSDSSISSGRDQKHQDTLDLIDDTIDIVEEWLKRSYENIRG
jgi:hypothetical protein